jgi:hypothetical protein
MSHLAFIACVEALLDNPLLKITTVNVLTGEGGVSGESGGCVDG